MPHIKAFVGHSFTDDDEAIVSIFLKFFDQIRGSLHSFEWVNAQKAAPQILAEKVRGLMEDRNTFIGICTKKELALSPSAVSQSLIFSNYSKSKNSDIEWKTSDWIIQEIGLALAHSMSFLILLEEGCRRPGGLQGDVEFISFTRDAPQKSFGKILEMLQDLSPTTSSRSDMSKDSEVNIASEASTRNELDVSDDEEETPQPDWSFENFKNAYFWQILKESPDRAQRISDAFYQSDHAQSQGLQAQWESKCEEWKLIFGQGGSLQNLERLAEQNPHNFDVVAAFASGMSIYKEHIKSADIYQKAANLASEPSDILNFRLSAAHELAKFGDASSALDLIDSIKPIISDSQELEVSFSQRVKSIADEINDDFLKIQAMERIVHLRPYDDDERFSLAYSHSQLGNDELALHHYLSIPHSRRNNFAWNNIGVAYQHFSAPARAIKAFEKAASDGNTLAMSNLAYRYMNVGFLREAKDRLDCALKGEDVHKSVNEALAALSEVDDNEAEVVENVLEGASMKIEAFKKLGRAICRPDVKTLEKKWNGPQGEYVISISNRDFEARVRYMTEVNALLGLGTSIKPAEYEAVFKGSIIGHQVSGDIQRKRLSPGSQSLLGDFEVAKRFAMIFSDDLRSVEVIEDIGSRNPRYYQLSASTPK
ncbi:hypothetical protein J3454_06260 [Erythrobacter sp. NFXS35]|uniref:tetratricopeptide repeat protein n=1 Tax=Erythrobacter sp. NFXS35 TaxID=2818436 RepID=UPI0032DEFA08